MKYTPQQLTQRLPNLIIQDNKPELKKFSTTYSNEFNLKNKKKNPNPDAVIQDKLVNKNQFFNKLNEMTTTLMNNNSKIRVLQNEKKSLTPNDNGLTHLMNSLSKDSHSMPLRNSKELKPIKPRKFVSNKEVNDMISTSSFNFQPNINIIKVEKEKEEIGMTGYNSQHNVNKYIQVYSCKSRAGNQVDGSRKTNQDSYMANQRILNLDDYISFGVYDGHGMFLFLLILFIYIKSYLNFT